MRKHLAIFKKEAAEKILTGNKTIECRFSRLRTTPFGQINSGDLVYIKPSGKDIIGQFRVKKVIFFDGLDLSDLSNLGKKYGKELDLNEDYWKEKDDIRFATLIFIGNCTRFITPPVKIPKKDSRGWVVLD